MSREKQGSDALVSLYCLMAMLAALLSVAASLISAPSYGTILLVAAGAAVVSIALFLLCWRKSVSRIQKCMYLALAISQIAVLLQVFIRLIA